MKKILHTVDGLGEGGGEHLPSASVRVQQSVSTNIQHIFGEIPPSMAEVYDALVDLVQQEKISDALECVGRLLQGGIFPSADILEDVILAALEFRMKCVQDRMQEALEHLDIICARVFEFLGNTQECREIYGEKIRFLYAKYRECCGDVHHAMTLYAQAFRGGSLDAGISLYRLYESEGKIEESLIFLEEAYTQTAQASFVHILIHSLWKYGRKEEAFRYYQILSAHLGEQAPPWFFYTRVIETDTALDQLAACVFAAQDGGGILLESPIKDLSIYAQTYIASCLQNMETEMQDYETDRRIRAMHLMYHDIFTCAHDRSISDYITLLSEIINHTDPQDHHELYDFFDTHPPRGAWIPTQPRESSKESAHMSLRQHAFQHVACIAEIFLHPTTPAHIQHQAINFLDHTREYGIGWNHDLAEWLIPEYRMRISQMQGRYEIFPESVREAYMEYVARFDVEYGTLIRRYIQYRAKLPGIEGEVVGDVLHAHPRVALLYWMEKFLYQETPFHEGDDMCEVIEEFGIHSVSLDDAAAFALVLLEYDIYLGVEYLCMLPKLFEHTQVLLFLATELPSHGREIEKNITRLIRDCTGVNITRRMLECVRTARDDDVLMPLSQRRQALMAHAWYASGYEAQELYAIGQEYRSLDALLEAGHQWLEEDESMRAHDCFIQAFFEHNSGYALQMAIECLLSEAHISRAHALIFLGAQHGYTLFGQVMAVLLDRKDMQGVCMLTLLFVLRGGNLDELPPDIFPHLHEAITQILDTPDIDGDAGKVLEQAKIYASGLAYHLSQYSGSKEHLHFLWEHWQYIESLFGMYEGEELYAQIHQVLSPLIFAADIDTTKVRHTGADAHVLLAEYIQSILSYMQKSMAYTSKPTYRDIYTRILTSAASMLRRLSADSREAIALIQEIPFSFESLRGYDSHALHMHAWYEA